MRVRLETIGCRVNIGEVEEMARSFASRGHRVVGPGDGADLVVVNTCAVTSRATRKSRKLLRQLRARHPEARIVCTGCHASLDPDSARTLGVDRVIDNDAKDDIVEILEREGLLVDSEPKLAAAEASVFAGAVDGRTRAFVKVQDGCDNRCGFCIVTVARGASRSRPLTDVLARVRQVVALGYREVVLSGVHLGSWGRDLGRGLRLDDLVRRVLAETDVERLRLSSLEPWDLGPGFFDLWQDPRLQPHLHLPLQSGCDATLRRMSRRTTRAEFRALVERARRTIPEVAVSSDVIVGFPGETEAEFEESIGAVEELGFSRLHVFRYSARPGTAAARMRGTVPVPVAQERSRRMHRVAARASERFHASLVGRVMPVLWESGEDLDLGVRWSGLTGNYARVLTITGSSKDLRNRVTATRLDEVVPGALRGTVREAAASAAAGVG
jgi:threonylcarbamoyladenosine tRNA methylthiotransferase MtaB